MPAQRGYLVVAPWMLAVVLGLLIPLALPKPAYACLCSSSGSPKEAMAKADAVFFGRVTATTALNRPDGSLSSADPVTVEFDVIGVWKGPPRETLTVETERSGISCGFEFKEGRRYIVYTWGGNRTGVCTRTAPIWLAARDFAVLGRGSPPESAPDARPNPEPVAALPTDAPSRGSGCGKSEKAGGSPTDLAPLILLAGLAWLGSGRWRRRQ